jgi:lysophospholipase L1-like esterase
MRLQSTWRRFAVLALLALGVESAARVRQRIKFGTFGRVQEFATDAATGLTIPVPGRDTGAIRINSLGFRGGEIEDPKPARRVRIAFLGGSTTYCAEVSSDAATWPARTCELLAQEVPGCTLDFVNGGVPGYTLEEIQTNLEQRVARFAPDVIVFYEATNDLTRDTRELARAQGVYTEHADRDSWLSRVSLAWYLVEKNLVLRRRQSSAVSGVGRVRFDPRELSRGFEQRLRRFVATARERAKVVALVTFSIHARREQGADEQLAACNTSLYYMPYMTPALLLDGFAEYNRVIRQVATETGVLLIEAAESVPGDSQHFNDSVHFKDAGADAMARVVADGLKRSGQLAGLCAR